MNPNIKILLNSIPFFWASWQYLEDHIGMVQYLVVSGTGWALGYFYWKWRSHIEKMRDYGNRYEPIFVLEFPGEWMNFPRTFQDNYIIAAPGAVGQVVVRERLLLAKAGNQRGVEVIPILFQCGKYRTESPQGFKSRCLLIMSEKLNAVNEHLQKQNPLLYNQVHHGETVTDF